MLKQVLNQYLDPTRIEHIGVPGFSDSSFDAAVYYCIDVTLRSGKTVQLRRYPGKQQTKGQVKTQMRLIVQEVLDAANGKQELEESQ